jgi:transposase InsO family protein
MAHLAGDTSLSELCRQYEISRKTGYKWVQRFFDGGMPALMDRSRAPRAHPQAIDETTIDAIVALKERYPTWGAKKLRSRLQVLEPQVAWPSESTFGRILKRRGLVEARKRRRRTPLAEPFLATADEPNHIWCVDYKGKFRVGQKYCHPLTITDSKSRFALCCSDTESERTGPAQAAFERTFHEYGLPWRIRSDNGVPFASTGIGGLSRLSVWWVKLGILPERTRPGHPQDNGMHERMHRTLKAETAKPAQATLSKQQRAFDAWRHEFNHERPHEALGMQTPASQYHASERKMPEELGDPQYPSHFEVRRLQRTGRLKIKQSYATLGVVLGHEAIGLEPLDDGLFQVWFGPIYLGLLAEQAGSKLNFNRNIPYPPSP